MSGSRRQAEILRLVREQGACSISELAEQLQVSGETIRRNIAPLLQRGSIARFHGGVMLPDRLEEPPFRRRMKVNKEAKQRVAALLASRIQDGDSLILDNGTTTTYVAEALVEHRDLVVITNSAEIACLLAPRNGNRVFMAGGELRADDVAAFGPQTTAFLRQFQVKYAVLSVAGINPRGEFVVFHLGEAEFGNAAIDQAEHAWFIADHTKFGRAAPIKICDVDRAEILFTDRPPPGDYADRFKAAGVEVIAPDV